MYNCAMSKSSPKKTPSRAGDVEAPKGFRVVKKASKASHSPGALFVLKQIKYPEAAQRRVDKILAELD